MQNFDLIVLKAQLVNCEQYKKIRDMQLEHIVELSNTPIDPLLLKGMLKLLADTQQWENDFKKIKARKENINAR